MIGSAAQVGYHSKLGHLTQSVL